MSGTPDAIVGKTISGVIIKRGDTRRGSPSHQLFLIFDDDTSYEFWVSGEYSELKGAAGLDKGGVEAVRNYMPGMKIIFEKLLP